MPPLPSHFTARQTSTMQNVVGNMRVMPRKLRVREVVSSMVEANNCWPLTKGEES